MTDEVIWSQAVTEKHRRILEAALEMFADQGYAGTSTNEIAKRAGVSEAAIFKHYKTKKDLLVGVVGPILVKALAPAATAAVKDILRTRYDDVESFITALVSDRVFFVQRHQYAAKIAVQELPFHPEIRALVEDIVVREIWPLAQETVKDLQTRGKMIAVPPEIVLRTVLSLIVGHFVHRYLVRPDQPFDRDAELRTLIQLLTNALSMR